jgi:HPt (histidine-containing phosphotransfer) domain-containing protein
LIDRVEGDFDFLEETITMLEQDGPGLIGGVRGAVAARDAAGVIAGAHTLKSMVANFCAGPATNAARDVETLGRTGQLDGVDEAVDRLDREVERLRDSLRRWVDGKSS